MTLKIRKVQGSKGDTPEQKDKDRIVVLECDRCNKLHAMKYPQVAGMLIEYCNVENNLYPKSQGKRGEDMFIDYVTEAMKTHKLPDRDKYRFKK